MPIPTGSVTDLTAILKKTATVDEINAAMQAAAEGPLKGILKYSDGADRVVRHRHRRALVDLRSPLTKVIDDQVKIVSWYDNEWGYSNRLVDLIGLVAKSL